MNYVNSRAKNENDILLFNERHKHNLDAREEKCLLCFLRKDMLL